MSVIKGKCYSNCDYSSRHLHEQFADDPSCVTLKTQIFTAISYPRFYGKFIP